KIAIEEPSIEETVKILAGLRGRYEDHHGVRYTDAALEAAAKLASRHLRDSRLPDSAIDLIDEAGAVTRIQTLAAHAESDPGVSADAPSLPTAPPVVDAREIERIAARAARIPD